MIIDQELPLSSCNHSGQVLMKPFNGLANVSLFSPLCLLILWWFLAMDSCLDHKIAVLAIEEPRRQEGYWIIYWQPYIYIYLLTCSMFSPSQKLFWAGWAQSLFSGKADGIWQVLILTWFWNNSRYLSAQTMCPWAGLWSQIIIDIEQRMLLNKLYSYLALSTTFDYIQKIIPIIIIDTALKTPATHLLTLPLISPIIWHQTTFNKVGTCWHAGDTSLACILIERRGGWLSG